MPNDHTLLLLGQVTQDNLAYNYYSKIKATITDVFWRYFG